MIKFKNTLCVIASSLILTTSVNAATLVVSSGETHASEKSNSVEISLKDSDWNLYKSLEFELSLSGTTHADLKDFSPKGLYTFKNISGNKFSFEASESFSEGVIGVISYETDSELAENFTITPVNVKLTKTDGSEGTISGVTTGNIKYLAPASSNSYLTNMTVSQGELSPEFNKDVLEYTVNVSDKISVVRLSATTEDDNAKVEGTGNKTLVLGENKYEIVVTAEDKKTKTTYKVTINRGEQDKPSAYIKELKINNVGCKLTPVFDSKNNKYTVEASKDITSLTFDIVPEEKAAKVEIEGNEDFKLGENKVLIKVTSSDETLKQEYEFTVNVGSDSDEATAPAKPIDKSEDEKKRPKTLIIIIIAVVVILIVGGVTFLLFRKKKTGKKNDNNKNSGNNGSNDNQNDVDAVSDVSNLEKTTTYDINQFRAYANDDEEIEKTKEFSFKDIK